MFKTNEYFEGKVKSIAFETAEGPATIGAMAEGEYEFGTSSQELMSVVSGMMGSAHWFFWTVLALWPEKRRVRRLQKRRSTLFHLSGQSLMSGDSENK